MNLWQMDIVGRFYLLDGTELKVLSGIDDHSRYCVSARLMPRATARPVCDALERALEIHGVPDQILSDNGKVFTNRFGQGPGPVLFDRICANNDIKHILTAPYSPTITTGSTRPSKSSKPLSMPGSSTTTPNGRTSRSAIGLPLNDSLSLRPARR
jgi:transposase InsO family protein